MSRRICVVTGSRAEFGLLEPILREIVDCPSVSLQLVATGAHLSNAFGQTFREIEAAGFTIDSKVECLMDADTASSINNSVAIALMKFDEIFRDSSPEIVVVLGDRYEILAVVLAALFRQIPVAHISGGEVTKGAFDDAIRHAITKMSHFHFVSTEAYRRRVIQLGEEPDRVFCVGALGIDNVNNLQLVEPAVLAKELKIKFADNNLLVTFHPSTLEPDSGFAQLQALLDALDRLKDSCLIFTKANADTAGVSFNRLIESFVLKHRNSHLFDSLGVKRYFSMVSAVDVVIGNSSSGLVEVPSLKTPTINIGDRQLGRICADSVINCGPTVEEISGALKKAFSSSFQRKVMQTKNPYEGGVAAKTIVEVLANIEISSAMKKSFHDIV